MQTSIWRWFKRVGPAVVVGLAACLVGSLAVSAVDLDAGNGTRIAASETGRDGVTAVDAQAFLDSLGVVTFIDQGADAASYVDLLKYTGIRNIRDGIHSVSGAIMLHQQAGVRVNLVGTDIKAMLGSARSLAAANVLLSLEGPNEPNNFPITYKGQKGGGTGTWVPVAEFQRDLYKVLKSDEALAQYPVFQTSVGGAEADNVGLQFLTIPENAGTLLPGGTKYADFANVHNYVIGNGIKYIDNQAWQAADPTHSPYWDGLYYEYGKTWKAGFRGYSNAELETLPRVTTETGWDSVAGVGGEKVQASIVTNVYLAQFKRGWAYTFIYCLRDNEGGVGNFGLFHADQKPKPAATYIHNLTAVLRDGIHPVAHPGKLDYAIRNASDTVHDLLLEKRDGVFDLVIWGEQVSGHTNVTVELASPHAAASAYDISVGTAPVRTFAKVRSVPLEISDHAIIVEISD